MVNPFMQIRIIFSKQVRLEELPLISSLEFVSNSDALHRIEPWTSLIQ